MLPTRVRLAANDSNPSNRNAVVDRTEQVFKRDLSYLMNVNSNRDQVIRILNEGNRIEQRRVSENRQHQRFQQDEQDDQMYKDDDDSSSDISYDEDMILESVRCCETKEDMRLFIEADEEVGKSKQSNKIYQDLKKKTLLLMGVAKKYLSTADSSSSASKDLERKNVTLNEELSKQHSANLVLYNKLEELRQKQAVVEQKCLDMSKEKAERDSQFLLNDDKDISQMDSQQIHQRIKSIIEEEKKAQKRVKDLAEKKNVLLQALIMLADRKQESGKSLCIVCSEKPINCLLQPCNHACTCYECAQKLETCPMDRLLFTNTKKFFLS